MLAIDIKVYMVDLWKNELVIITTLVDHSASYSGSIDILKYKIFETGVRIHSQLFSASMAPEAWLCMQL